MASSDLSDQLIELARRLVELDSGRPRQATLRRAVSTAYYAAFHAVCSLCADQFVGWSAPWEDYSSVYRALDHRDFKAAAGHHLGSRSQALLASLRNLRDLRFEADYSRGSLSLSRASTRDTVENAGSVIAALRALSADEKRSLAVALIVRRQSR